MFNPILNELAAREQHKDHLRQAEQHRLAKAATARQPAQTRVELYSAADPMVTKTAQ
jgi:hypothetical protein